jgi:hypothetical protein
MDEREGKKEEREALVPLRREARMNPEKRKGEKTALSFAFPFFPSPTRVLLPSLLSCLPSKKTETILPPPSPREKNIFRPPISLARRPSP